MEYTVHSILEVFDNYLMGDGQDGDREFLVSMIGFPLRRRLLDKEKVEDNIITKIRAVMQKVSYTENLRERGYYESSFSNAKDGVEAVRGLVQRVLPIFSGTDDIEHRTLANNFVNDMTVAIANLDKVLVETSNPKRDMAQTMLSLRRFDEVIECANGYSTQIEGVINIICMSAVNLIGSQRTYLMKYIERAVEGMETEVYTGHQPEIPSSGIAISGNSTSIAQPEKVEAGSAIELKDMDNNSLGDLGFVRLKVMDEKTKEKTEVIRKRPEAKGFASMSDEELAKLGLTRVSGFTRKDGIVVKEHYRKIRR